MSDKFQDAPIGGNNSNSAPADGYMKIFVETRSRVDGKVVTAYKRTGSYFDGKLFDMRLNEEDKLHRALLKKADQSEDGFIEVTLRVQVNRVAPKEDEGEYEI